MSVDDDRQQLLEGKQAARELISKDTAEKLEEMRNRAVKSFFGEEGVPPHLKEGWAALDQLRAMRQSIGYPMPPGGVLLLGRQSVLAGCLAEMHTALAEMLSVSVDRLKMRLERDDQGHLTPVADIDLPEDWLVPCVKDPRLTPDQAAKQYLGQCVSVAQAQFRISALERLGYCDAHRPELAQTIESFGCDE